MSVLLAAVGLALVAGLIVIASHGPRLAFLKIEPHKEVASDPDSHLRPRIDALRSTTLPPGQARQQADDLYAEAKDRATQEEIKLLIDRFAGLETEDRRKQLQAQRAQVLALADEAEFAEAQAKVSEFEKASEHLLNRILPVVKLLREEIASLRAAVELKRKERFEVDLGRLRQAVDKGSFDAASDVVGKIYLYADSSMKAQADAVWGPFFAKFRERDLQKARDAAPGTPLEIGQKRDEEPRPSPEEERAEGDAEEEAEALTAPEEEDDFFGGKEPEKARGESGLFAVLKRDRGGTLTITLEGEQVELRLGANAKLFRDIEIPPKKFIENLQPELPVIFLAETTELKLWEDPAQGRRIRNALLLLCGDGWPQAPSWRDPRNKSLLWHRGTVRRLLPQPALFRLGQQDYALLGYPSFVVKREKLARNDLRSGSYQAFVKGKAEGLGKGTATFTAEMLVLLPAGRVSRTLPYRAVLED